MSKKFKISILPLIVGVVMLVAGIIIIVSANNRYSELKKEYNASLAQYEVEYDEWYDKWWNDHTATLNDQPKHPGFKPDFPAWGFVGIVIAVFSAPFLFTGTTTLLVSSKKKDNGQQQIANNRQNSNSSSNNFLDLLIGNRKSSLCEYCGAKLLDGSVKCDACGARAKK